MEASFNAVVFQAETLLASVNVDVTALISMTTDAAAPREDKKLLEAARSCALQVSRLVELIEGQAMETLPRHDAQTDLQVELLASSTRAIRDGVLQLLRCAKEAWESPFDEASVRAFKDARASVTEKIEQTNRALKLLQVMAIHGRVDESRSESAQVSALAEAFAGCVAHLVEVLLAPQHDAEPDDDGYDETPVLEAMRRCVLALKTLEDHAAAIVDLNALKHSTKGLLTLAREYALSATRSEADLVRVRGAVATVTADIRGAMFQMQRTVAEALLPTMAPTGASPARVAAHDIVLALSTASGAVLAAWQAVPSVAKEGMLLRVEEMVQRAINAAAPPSAAASPVASPSSAGQSPMTTPDSVLATTPDSAAPGRGMGARLSPRESPSLPQRSATLSTPPLRGRAHTSSIRRLAQTVMIQKEAAAKQQLDKFTGITNLAQWQELLSNKDDLIHVGGVVGDITVMKDLSVSQLSRAAVAYILSSNAAVITKKTTAEAVQSSAQALLHEAVTVLQTMTERALVGSVAVEVLELLRASAAKCRQFDPATLEADKHIVDDASQETFGSLLRLLYAHSNDVRTIVIHLLTTLQAVEVRIQSARPSERGGGPLALSVLLQTAACGAVLVELVRELHTVVVTARAMASLGSVRSASSPSLSPRNEGAGQGFWSEVLAARSATVTLLPPASPATPPLTSSGRSPRHRIHRLLRRDSDAGVPGAAGGNGAGTAIGGGGGGGGGGGASSGPSTDGLSALPKRGTLNALVEAITHWAHYDHSYMSAFIATYRSFTTPALLLQRLLERYDCPAAVPRSEATSVQMRVPIVLKYWLENQPDDFDDDLTKRLTRFVETSLRADNADLAALLLKELERQANARRNRKAIFETPPTDFSAPKGPYTPSDLVMQMASDELARQLTLIDHAIYCAIHPTELLNQAWNKAARRHRSLNVVALVTRLNRISYWIPSCVLWQDTEELRAQAIAKFIEIARALRGHNNFHTLMGIIAGLNVASVSKSRLRNTWALVSSDLQTAFEELEAMMSPTSSFKAYRAALRTAKVRWRGRGNGALPCIPYLGCYLGDLTFVDEGNPDTVDGLINFEKRLDIWRYIQEVESYKKEPFQWPQVEPLHSLLTTLPAFGDKDLYGLSLMVEKRVAKDPK